MNSKQIEMKINHLRLQLHMQIESYGLSSPEALHVSRKLDRIINDYYRRAQYTLRQ